MLIKHKQIDTTYFIAKIEFKKSGRLVNIYANTELRHSLPANTETVIGTIPTEYCPTDYDYKSPLIMANRYVGAITFFSNGNISVNPMEMLDQGWLGFNVSYLVR